LFEHDLFGKPLHTFPDHALAKTGGTSPPPVWHVMPGHE
jgi:hypothetical protein